MLLGDELSRCRILLGCTNLDITLFIFDVHFSIFTMLRYNDAPMKVHIGDILIIFVYLNQQIKLWIICYTIINEDQGEVYLELNWLKIYPDTVEGGCQLKL